MSLEPKSRLRAAGFTIVELMVTVFIAAILFAVAVPSFRQMMASNRLATQTNDLIGAVNFARSEAITRNRNVSLCRADNDAAITCSGAAGDWTAWIVRNTDGTIARRGAVPTYGGGIVVQTTLSNDTMTFGSDGLARNGTGTALINNHTMTICTGFNMGENRRVITLGAGSRVTTTRETGACP